MKIELKSYPKIEVRASARTSIFGLLLFPDLLIILYLHCRFATCFACLQDYCAYGTLHQHTGIPMDANLKCILCVEDEPEMIDLIRLILGRRGFEIKGAAGGVEGLEMIREDPPDLVLLDLMMPDMDGWEVYQQMKADEKTKNIPVIVVTAKAQSIDKVLGLHIAKVDDYITKPFSPQDLMNSVDKVLKSKE
jgi:two-component system, OmpR family, response regulator VicR